MGIGRTFPFLAFMLWASLASAQTALDEAPLLPDLAQIVERGTLVVAQAGQDVPPMFAEQSGKLVGFDIDLARAMADLLRVDLDVRRTAETFDEVVAQVATGDVDLGISALARTARRAKHVLFSQPYLTTRVSVLINRVRGLKFQRTCPSLAELLRTAEFTGLLGLEMGSAHLAGLRELDPDVEPREFQSKEDLLAAVLAGEVAASVQSELLARRFLAENPAARIRLNLCEIADVREQIAVAVPPGRGDLLRWVNVFLADRDISFDANDIIAHEGAWEFF